MLDLIVVIAHRQAVDLTSIDYHPSILSKSTIQVRIDLTLLLVRQNLISIGSISSHSTPTYLMTLLILF